MTSKPKTVAAALFLLGTAVTALQGMAATEATEQPLKVAFLGFQFINDSLEPTRDDEKARIGKVEQQLTTALESSDKFTLVPLSEDQTAKIKAGQPPGECGGCEIAYGKDLGGDRVAWGTVQKVSNLILNINVYMADVKSETMTFVHSNDIRGNSDKSWQFALDRLIKYYLLKDESKADN